MLLSIYISVCVSWLMCPRHPNCACWGFTSGTELGQPCTSHVSIERECCFSCCVYRVGGGWRREFVLCTINFLSPDSTIYNIHFSDTNYFFSGKNARSFFAPGGLGGIWYGRGMSFGRCGYIRYDRTMDESLDIYSGLTRKYPIYLIIKRFKNANIGMDE